MNANLFFLIYSPPEHCPPDNQCWLIVFLNTLLNTVLLGVMLFVLLNVYKRVNSIKILPEKEGYLYPDDQSSSNDI